MNKCLKRTELNIKAGSRVLSPSVSAYITEEFGVVAALLSNNGTTKPNKAFTVFMI